MGHWGYPGIITLMFLESSFFPFPSEVVIPPAGYLASNGTMNLWLVIASGISGSLLGAIFNYWLAIKFGRPFFEKYANYLFIKEKSLDKADRFFSRHGHISTFTGRLLPVIRQYISLPAGLARMDFFLFCLFTALGAGIWVAILAYIGYLFGNNQELVLSHVSHISYVLLISCIALIIIYAWVYNKRAKRKVQG